MMDVQILNDVADRIEKDSAGFDQGTCTQCVAAQVLGLFGEMPAVDSMDRFNFKLISDRASRLMGISTYKADLLFDSTWPEEWYERAKCPEYSYVTAENAVLVLRAMAKHPDDWLWPL